MANLTPANIIDSVAVTARMNATAASSDRALILGWVQEAVSIVAAEAEAVHDPTPTVVTLTSGTSQYDLGAAPFAISSFLSIDEVRLTDSAGTNFPLTQVPMATIDELRVGSQANSTPWVYAVDYPMFVLHPTPSGTTTLEVKGTLDGPTLADGSTAITFIPPHLQYGCLKEWALYRALEYKKQPEAINHQNNFLNSRVNGLPAAKRWIARVGGRQPMGGQGRYPIQTSPSQDMGWI
jgi:hypothetical protein